MTGSTGWLNYIRVQANSYQDQSIMLWRNLALLLQKWESVNNAEQYCCLETCCTDKRSENIDIMIVSCFLMSVCLNSGWIQFGTWSRLANFLSHYIWVFFSFYHFFYWMYILSNNYLFHTKKKTSVKAKGKGFWYETFLCKNKMCNTFFLYKGDTLN